MTVRVYRSTDASAPVLSGSAGALVSLLDACLVTGYGSTVAAGWTKPYATGATVAVYKQPVGSNGFYLKVTDAGTTVAIAIGYESMVDVSTGTGQFPTPGQRSLDTRASGYIQKSVSADSTACPWVLVASQKAFILIVNANRDTSQTPPYKQGFFFGDLISEKLNDKYATVMMAATTTSVTTGDFGTRSSTLASTQGGHFVARPWIQLGASIPGGKFADGVRSLRGSFADATDNSFGCAPFMFHEFGNIVRGRIPGLWTPSFWWQNTMTDGQIISFTEGELAGKTFQAHHLIPNNALTLIEISDTWY